MAAIASIAVLLLLCVVSAPLSLALDPEDEAVMTEWLGGLSRPSSWQNLTDICDAWLGILCYSNRIIRIVPTSSFVGNFSCRVFDLPYLEELSIDGREDAQLMARLDQCSNICGPQTALRRLSIRQTDSPGPIPLALGQCTNLTSLVLWDTELNGTIPATLFDSLALTALDLSFNKLSGEIPLKLFEMEELTTLELSFNRFTGQLPITTANINFVTFRVSNNFISGPIPDWIFSYTWRVLSLGYNNFSCPTVEQLTTAAAKASEYMMFDGLSDCRSISKLLPIRRNTFFYPTKVTFSAFPDFVPEYQFTTGQFYIHLKGADFYMFALGPSGEVFNEEYCVYTVQAIIQRIPYLPSHTAHLNREIPIVRYNSPTFNADRTQITFTSDLEGGGVFSQIFEINATTPSSLKFSFTLEDLPFSDQLNSIVPIQWTVRSPQSDKGNDFVVKPFAILEGQEYSSGIFSAETRGILIDDGVDETLGSSLGSKSPQLEATFAFTSKYFLDGKRANKPTSSTAEPYSLPFGPVNLLEALQPFPVPHLDDQSMVILIVTTFEKFNNTLFYDPSISLKALFDISPPQEPGAAPVVDNAVIVAPVMAVVAVGSAGVKPNSLPT